MAIKIRHGLKVDLPLSAPLGQLLFCTDTKELFIGTGASVEEVRADAAVDFSGLTSGTNNTATMTVDSGATLQYSGTGVVNANEIGGIDAAGNTPAHEGQLLISQPGNATAVWADPFVQGVYDPGTNTTTGGISSGFIKPVLVGGRGADGLLHDMATDNSGNLVISFSEPQHVIIDSSSDIEAVQDTAADLNATVVFASPQHTIIDSGTITTITDDVEVIQDTAADLNATIVFASPQHVIVDSASDIEAVQDTAADLNATIVFASPQHAIVDSGSIAVTQTTSPWVISGAITEATLDAALISQEATTSGVKGLTIFGAVTTNAPSYTTGKSDALSLDTSGLLRISLKDTPANTNKFLVTADAITFAAPQHVIVDSGTITTVSTVTAVTAITNALPAGTNIIGKVSQDTSPWVISGAVTEATLDAALISQEATTSGVKGLTVFGAVTTNAPSYTTGKSDALSLDTSGLLRISLKDTPANTNKFLVTADAITFAAPQHVIVDSGTVAVTQSTSPWIVAGGLTNNNAAPGANNVGALSMLANAADPSWTEGDLVTGSVDLAGNQRVKVNAALPAGTNVIGHVIVDSGTITFSNTTIAVTNTGTFATQAAATLTAETTKVIGTVRLVGNVGGVFDFAGQDATQPANALLVGAEFNTTPTTLTDGKASPLQLTSAANLKTDISTVKGTAPTTAGFIDIKGADGDVFVRQATAANLKMTAVLNDGSGNAITSTSSALDVNLKTSSITVSVKQIPQTSGGLPLPFSASVTTVVSVKSSAGQVYGWQILNTTAAIAYVQVFNVASGSVSLGSTAPDYVIPLPPSGGATIEISQGIAHSTAISIAATTTRTGSTTAACDVVMFYN